MGREAIDQGPRKRKGTTIRHTTMLRKAWLIGLLLLLSTGRPGPVSAGGDVWTSHGPEGGFIMALAIDPETPSTLYAGTWGAGAFKSTDGGGSWTALNIGLTNLSVCALAIDRVTPTILYAGTAGGGVFHLQQTPPQMYQIYLPLIVSSPQGLGPTANASDLVRGPGRRQANAQRSHPDRSVQFQSRSSDAWGAYSRGPAGCRVPCPPTLVRRDGGCGYSAPAVDGRSHKCPGH